MLELIWWVLFVTAFGATLGSFANVLIHRIPRGPVLTPVWSFCPNCDHRILFRDNIPIVSFLLLRGKCRNCSTPISARYPLIEAATIIAFLLVFDALCIAPGVRPDLIDRTAYDVSDRVLDAWPMVLAHLVLVAGLIVISVIDLEEYWVDLRVVGLLFLVGVLCQTVWTPTAPGTWQPPDAHLGAVAFAAAIGLLIAQFIYALLPQPEPAAPDLTDDHRSDGAAHEHNDTEFESQASPAGTIAGDPPTADAHAVARTLDAPSFGPPIHAPVTGESPPAELPDESMPPPTEANRPHDEPPLSTGPADTQTDAAATPARSQVAAGWLIALLVAASVAVILVGALARPEGTGFEYRSTYLFGLLFAFQIVGSARRRESDTAVVEAIEEERHSARATALGELLYLAPAIGLAIFASVAARNDWWGAFDWDRVYSFSLGDDWRPLAGLARGLWGALIAGALGWGVRIIFTLLLGKEAFGLGDVYIMAAAGAVAGWGVVCVGFFFAAFLALAGVILLIVVKRSRAIPFGPWLSLGIVATLISYGFVRNYLENGTKGFLDGITVIFGLDAK